LGCDWLREKAETLYIKSRDGLKLAGYWVPGESEKKIAVVVHGYHSIAGDVAEYAKIYLRNGYSVLLTENRGCGQSDGPFVGMGWPDRLDIIDWIRLLMEKHAGCQICLHGVSMGASAAILSSAEEEFPQAVKCIVSDCAFSSAFKEFAFRLKKERKIPIPRSAVLLASNLLLYAVAGYGFLKADAKKAARSSETPMFFIHGAEDSFTPPWMAKQLYQAKAKDKALWIAPHTGHAQTVYAWHEEYEKRVAAFASRFVK
jgi:fermentation-respiration switch protein FrsA (DUF1100 family)